MKSPHQFGSAFYIRQNKNKSKDYSIYCCIKVCERAPVEIRIAGGTKKEDWDLRKGRPKQTREDLITLSLYLDSIKAKLHNIYLELKLKEADFSAETIKNIYLGKGNGDLTILQLVDKAIEKYQKELAEGSLKNYGATRSYVEAYCKVKYKSGDVLLKFLTYAFIDELKTHILNNPLKSNDPCTNNGCMKHMERIKKMMAWAHDMRFIDRDVFASFKVKKRRYESKYLHWEQLMTVEQKLLHQPMLSLVRDLFVFCCYTGMAPIDMQNLRPHQIYSGIDGLTWMTYTRAKSNLPANVPLLSSAIALIKKYEWKKGDLKRTTVFPFVTNKDLNCNLKIISEICELGMSLNFYIARHTFGTTVTLLHGVPITSIKEMMGHDRIETTMNYAKANNSVVGADMMSLQEKIDRVTIRS